MSEFEANGFRGLWLPGRRLDGAFGVAIIAKRRFVVELTSATCVADEETPGFVMAAEHRDPDAPMASSVVQASEIALVKPKVDVIVQGNAHAPGGKPKRSFDVRVRIAGVLDRSLRVVGPRTVTWVAPKKKLTKKQREKGERQPYPVPTFGQAKTITTLPLTYEYAYGGSGALLIDAHLQEAAAGHQEEAAEAEARRQRKQEIEAELKAEQDAALAEVKAAEEAEAGGLSAVADDKARAKFSEAFEAPDGDARDGVEVLDEAELARLAAEERDVLVEASPMRFGDNVADRAPEVAEKPGAEPAEGEGDTTEVPRESGTAVLDITGFEAVDELKGAIEATDKKRRRELRDKDGTLIARVDGMEAVALSDDAWVEDAKRGPEVAPESEEESPHPMIPNLANPSGRGYCVSPMKEAVDGIALPCIEYPDRPLTPEDFVRDLTTQDLQAIGPVAGFGAYGAGWFPRARFAGVMPWDLAAAEEGKAAALEAFDPEDPDDQQTIKAISEMEIPVMRTAWYQEAHPEMQVESLKGDEEVFLDNFSPTGSMFFRLPGVHPDASIDLGEGAKSVLMHIDTLVIDADAHDAPSITLVWRGWHPMDGLEVFEQVGTIDVRLGEVDQAGWLEAAREQAARPSADTDGERLEAGDMPDMDAESVYRDDVHMRKAEARDETGVPREEGGTAIIDIGEERALTDDAFFDRVQADKEAFEGAAVEKAAKAEKARGKALKKKAREIADEELGVERSEDEE